MLLKFICESLFVDCEIIYNPLSQGEDRERRASKNRWAEAEILVNVLFVHPGPTRCEAERVLVCWTLLEQDLIDVGCQCCCAVVFFRFRGCVFANFNLKRPSWQLGGIDWRI